MKKILVFTVFGCLLLPGIVLFACRKKDAGTSVRTVSTVCRASYANEQWYKDMNAAFTMETGIAVNVQATPGNDDIDHMTKVNIELLAGGNIDVIQTLGPRDYKSRIDYGFFMPLGDVLKAAGVDYEKIWGKYIDYDKENKFYGVPLKQEISCVLFNKDMFDKAGIPYPSGNWTWDEYIDIAKRLSDPSKGIFGSFFPNDTPWFFYQARQQGVPLYKDNGKSNFDDPRFAEAMQWYYDHSHKDRINMTVAEIKAENVSWNYYAIAGGKLAMYPNMNWFIRLLNSQVDYPRDWKYGIATTPAAKNGGNKILVSMGYVSINKNAEHPKEAVEYLVWLGQNQWRYEGGIPALASLSAEDQNKVFESTAAASNGQITVQDMYKSFIDNGMGIEQTDIVGPAATEYNRIIIEEADRFNLDQQSLEATISRIVSRANEAIDNSQ